ncbi:hypothetical protein T02_4662 [Trichinella nativa]|uniref:Uncharacterized protein n=1 Tax=Trichinella nativa TaxID=6335 RepID=A0A0V1L4G7_9BILA|nr:hypothetical protein T02_4662 [Trichinella nativa]
MDWCPKFADRTRTIPAHRRPDRSLGVWRHRVGVRETPCSDLRMTVARETMAIYAITPAAGQ